MFPSFDRLAEAAVVAEVERELFASPAAPIVLVRRRPESSLAASVAPGNPWIGALLPYAPLHVVLLAAVDRPVVATSGNLSEEPLCTDNEEARRRLGGIADFFLMHNRPIARPVDDSVVKPVAGGTVLLRRARGFAPEPFPLPPGAAAKGPMLCVGGHLKNTIAVTAGANLVLSPHIGDLSNPLSMDAFRQTVGLLGSLYGNRFDRVVCDAHPDYASTRFAQSLSLPVVAVQHHLAHVLSCLLEHGGGPEQVLGVAWDGTGFGSDGTIWGGEFIVVDQAARTARRVAHLRPFRLPGGEIAVREPRRSALGLLYDLFAGDRARLAPLAVSLGFREPDAKILFAMLERGIQSPITTSAGRLFDGIAAVLGTRTRCTFEGQAAMELEFMAEEASGDGGVVLPVATAGEGGRLQIDWRPLLASVLQSGAGLQPSQAAAQFHRGLARSVADVASQVGIESVVLTGGCFQNARLLEETRCGLAAAGFKVLCHRDLPPNDGGISAGQALGALLGLTSVG
jgi:hydrogenase maturation protein HypF